MIEGQGCKVELGRRSECHIKDSTEDVDISSKVTQTWNIIIFTLGYSIWDNTDFIERVEIQTF